MEIKKVVVGPLKTNCYILIKGDKCLIIDPGAEYENIKNATQSSKIEGILITHNHFDHVGALKDFIDIDRIKVYDNSNLKEKMFIGSFSFDVIRTPGHKEDAVTYYFKDEQAMFVGDFIFKNNIGRCDLEGGNEDNMTESIKLIRTYDSNIKVYPGHGDETTLGNEKQNNYYFQI